MKFKVTLFIVWGITVVDLLFGQTSTINKAIFSSSNHQVETTIAINPTNKNNLIGGAIIAPPSGNGTLAYYYSLDGGNTWGGNEAFPSAGSSAGDPVVAFDGFGNAYYLYQIRSDRKLYLHKSTNGGQSWPSSRTTVVLKTSPKNVDKPWMAISPVINASGKYDIYVVYTETTDPPGTGETIWQATSDNGGVSFTNTLISNGDPSAGGANVAFGPTGGAYIAWGVFRTTHPFDQTAIKFSFSTTSIPVTQIGTYKKIGSDNRFVLKNSEVRVNSWPSIDVDRTEGSRRGWIYVAWADQRTTAPGSGTPDILLIKSTDNGLTWSSPVRVNTVTTNDQWFPSLSVDPDGNVNIIFYDSRNSSNNQSAQLYFARSTDGGVTFSNTLIGSLFTVASVPNANFMGDYVQLANWTGKSYPFWMRWDGTKYQAFFTEMTMPTVNVTVKNDFGGTQFGNFTVIEYPNNPVNYPSGTVFTWPNPSLRKIQAVDRYNNPFGGGQNWKFRDWNDQATNRANPQVFTISTLTPEIKAVFRKIHPVTVQTDLEGIGNHSGSIQFKDPLGTNTYETKTSPFFRDDIFEQETQTQYGVGAFSTLNNLLSTNWNFQSWNDGGALQHNILITAPTTFTALYKGNLRSNAATALAANSQRKVVTNQAGTTFHQLYESMGEIWYTTSTNEGSTWSAEARVSSGNGSNSHVSVAINQTDGSLYVTWQRSLGNGSYEILFRKRTSSSWQTQRVVAATVTPPSGTLPQPVISIKRSGVISNFINKILVMYIASSNSLRYRFSEDDGVSWPTEYTLNASGRFRPSLTAPWGNLSGSGVNTVDVITDTGLRIYRNRLVTQNSGQTWWDQWLGEELVPATNNSSALAIINAQISGGQANNYLDIVWELDEQGGVEAVCYQRRSFYTGQWSAMQEFPGTSYQKPTVTILSSGNVVMVWGNGSSILQAKYTQSTNSWSGVSNLGNGVEPNISVTGGSSGTIDPAKAKFVFRDQASFPYPVKTQSQPAFQKVAEGEEFLPEIYARRISVTDTLNGAGFLVELEIPKVKTAAGDLYELPFVVTNDTLLNLSLDNSASYFNTQSGTLPLDADSLILDVKIHSRNAASLKDSGSPGLVPRLKIQPEQVPALAQSVDLADLAVTPKLTQRQSVGLQTLKGQLVHLELEVTGLNKARPSLIPVLTHVHYIDQVPALTKGTLDNIGTLAETPLEFGLEQNYPNPFNPSTVISYAIPKAAFVSLRIYNLRGQQITTLVEKEHLAGRYQVQWDGHDQSGLPVAAGLYFYRVEAGDFSQVKRMILVK